MSTRDEAWGTCFPKDWGSLKVRVASSGGCCESWVRCGGVKLGACGVHVSAGCVWVNLRCKLRSIYAGAVWTGAIQARTVQNGTVRTHAEQMPGS